MFCSELIETCDVDVAVASASVIGAMHGGVEARVEDRSDLGVAVEGSIGMEVDEIAGGTTMIGGARAGRGRGRLG